jgi:hypothetical protein
MPQSIATLPTAADFARTAEQKGKARTFVLYAKSLAATAEFGGALAHLRATHPQLQHLDALERSLKAEGTRAAVPAGATTGWGSALVSTQHFGAAFLAELQPITALGKLAFQPVPTHVRVPRDTSEVTASWVIEGRAVPVFKGAFDTVALPSDPKLAMAVVFSKELAQSADPAAEAVFSNKLRNAIARGSDRALLDPSLAATADTPASITYAAPAIASTGGDAEAVASDLAALSAMLTDAGFPFAGRCYIASPKAGEYLGSLRYSTGVLAFPGVGAAGGDILGVPLVTSDLCGPQVVLLHAPSLLVADGGIELSASSNAALEMTDAPDADSTAPAGATEVVSMMQTNSVALQALRFLNFTMGRETAIARLTGFTYGVGARPDTRSTGRA